MFGSNVRIQCWTLETQPGSPILGPCESCSLGIPFLHIWGSHSGRWKLQPGAFYVGPWVFLIGRSNSGFWESQPGDLQGRILDPRCSNLGANGRIWGGILDLGDNNLGGSNCGPLESPPWSSFWDFMEAPSWERWNSNLGGLFWTPGKSQPGGSIQDYGGSMLSS